MSPAQSLTRSSATCGVPAARVRVQRGAAIVVACLALCLGPAGTATAQQGQATGTAPAESATTVTVRDALVAPLGAAQDLLREGQAAQALERLRPTDGIADKTPLETYVIQRMRAAAYSATGDMDAAGRSIEQALATQQTPPAELPGLIDALVALHYNAKRYQEAARWSRQLLSLPATPATRREPVRMILAQSLYLSGDYADASTELRTLIRAAEQAGRAPTQMQLDLFASAQIQLKDDTGYLLALEQLLTWYPRKEYWADLLPRLERLPGFDRRLSIDAFRLQFAAGAFTDSNDYLEYAQLALKAGFHAESHRSLATGFEAGLLGQGADAVRHKAYLDQVGERAEEERRQLAAVRLTEPATGDELFELGWRQHTLGQTQQAIVRMQQAIDKGDVRDIHEARLRLGSAMLAAGDKARAREMFRRVQDARLSDGASDLARLWSLLAR